MQAKSIKGISPEEIGTSLKESMTDGFKPTIAICFLPNKNDVQKVCNIFDKNQIAIFGASAYGQFIDKNYDTDSIVVLMMEIKREYFKIEFRETGSSSTEEIAKSIGEIGKTTFNQPAFLVASGGIKTDGERIIEGIQNTTGKETALFGGLAASNLDNIETFVFTNSKFSTDGLIALILNEEKISVNGYATGGSKPVGMFHTITSSDGNIVYTIDDQPALDLILRYSGKNVEDLKSETDMLNLASSFHIQLQRENRSPISRTPVFANFNNKSVVFAGSLPKGSKVKFCMLPGFEVVDNVIVEFANYKKIVGSADAMILFSCQGREIAFGPWMTDEIQRINQLWNSPMIGLFSFGEIGRNSEGQSEFYNLTCSLALLKEIECNESTS